MKNIFKINGVEFGGKQLPIIAGPCVIESRDHILYMAEKIKAITDKNKLPLIFKSSFDKGNRSSHSSFRGPGIDSVLN
jgi:3-deoxy-D-manno-octulosonic acid (KDO) 8-phosphate synthase